VTQTLLSMLKDGERAAAGAPALIERRGHDYVEISHDVLSAAIAAAAQALAEAGVGAGAVIGVWLPNGLAYLAVEFAAAALGVSVLGINTRYGVFELQHLMMAGRLALIVAPDRFLDLDFSGRLTAAFAAARKVAPDLPAPAVLVTGAGRGALDAFDLGGGTAVLSLDGPAPPLADAGKPEAPVNYFTTSGSTGAPKLAGHDQASIVIHSPLAAALFDMRPGDVVLGVLPFCGVFGFNIAMAALASGASLLIDPVFDARTVLEAMARFGVSQAFGGDDLWGRLYEAWREHPIALTRLRRGAIAEFEGRAVSLGAWAREALGAELTGLYGSSELMSFVLTRPVQADMTAQVKGGGRLISDQIALRIADPETGEVLAGGGTGELQARGYNRLIHYLGNAEATERAITADGWYRTGDLVSDDGDGGFAYLCRNTEALRLRGFLVEPAEIEQHLMSHPGVETARVVGVRTDRGDTPVGFATLSDRLLTGEALVAYCRQGLAAFKAPVRIVILDAFPLTAGTNGSKIRIEELKRMAKACLDQPQAPAS
jgi:acyl-CoA synthetase (AMP-forming)/AMP-acid ligase II